MSTSDTLALPFMAIVLKSFRNITLGSCAVTGPSMQSTAQVAHVQKEPQVEAQLCSRGVLH